jgi:hypothetical protein
MHPVARLLPPVLPPAAPPDALCAAERHEKGEVLTSSCPPLGLPCPALLHASPFSCAHCTVLAFALECPVRTPCRMAAACARSRQVQAYHQHPRPSARNRAQIARRHTFSAAPPAAPAGLAPGRVSVYGPADVGAPAGWFVPTGLTAQQHQQYLNPPEDPPGFASGRAAYR